MFSRIGGEGFDLPTTMKKSFTDPIPIAGAASAEDHYLELDQNEQDMLMMVCESFSKVIVIVNSNTPMELGFLDEADDHDSTMNNYDYASHIGGALWIGGPGNSGIMALGRVLNGSVNPSGRTIDTYARDFTKSTTWNNIGLNGVVNSDAYTVNGVRQDAWYVDYEESIYVGYRYYETRGFTDGESWYDDAVVFPYGYGLSYTDFEWSISSATPAANAVIEKDTQFEIKVEVKNVGTKAGKDVVQLYVTAPYKNTEIEKSHVVLVGFSKTKLIQPNETDTVTVSFEAYDFASYDYNDANKNEFKGYELDEGEYEIKVCSNAHTVKDSVKYSVLSGIKYKKDNVTGTDVVNRFDDTDDQLTKLLSRIDWMGTWPQRRTNAERETTSDFIKGFKNYDSLNPLTADSDEVKNSDLTYANKKAKSEVQLYMLMNTPYDDDEAWNKLLNEITVSSMIQLCDYAAYNTAGIDYIGKPVTIDADGPVGFVTFLGKSDVNNTCVYASECTIASTWNVELAHEMGVSVGCEGIVGKTDGNGNTLMQYSGWYAPGINIHRSEFSGRNYEYYSEDPVMNGILAAQVIKGGMSKGVYTYVKHFAVNDEETHRTGVCAWLTEQSLREIYIKAFEYAVKDGGTTGMMSSFNRIGTKWAGGDYRLLTEILRNEWGFKGAVISDFATGSYMNHKQMAYAGGDLILNNVGCDSWVDKSDPMDIYVLKKCTKNALYMVSRSNAMNGIGEGTVYRTGMPIWEIALFIADAVVFVLIVVWGIFALRKKNQQ